ncbi:c-type cytochrome domain-containing protein [Enhygromyxa salina]|uniref:Uncharacterized protein n=1 Tax=Enhygromyxa salina TaxID=215803 RepID=A0A2S9YKX1_9BACT|nr:c-type cytochrome domain-containing protein [Enhygromyxa salina]PRQ05708.1 hypothetical protein ENSA7_43790 [Enhygromyxa salina]
MSGRWHAIAVILVAMALAAGCEAGNDDDNGSGDAIPECVEYTLDGCAPLYPASYDQVWTQTLDSGCAEFGTACHAQADAAGATRGLTFVDPQQTYDHLTMTSMTSELGPLVVPGDPLCSPLFVRLATDDAAIRMPPGGTGLSAGALCSIGTWIADGASYQPP